MKRKPRLQSIKYDRKGRPYVTHYGVRLYLDEFTRITDRVGVKAISNWGGYKVELHGDMARVTLEME